MNLISIESLSKSFNEKTLFSGISLGIDEGEKIGLIGPNGCGKSTFLRLLAGEAEPDAGKLTRNGGLSVGLLQQNPAFPAQLRLRDFLFELKTPVIDLIKEYRACFEEYSHSHASGRRLADLSSRMEREHAWEVEHEYLSYLSELGVGDPEQLLDGLSGGTRKKAALARALAARPNLLLLDEPTNHLDIQTVEWLEKYLAGAKFGFILVTHDRYFLNAVCTTILEMDSSGIWKYPGNYSTFLERREQRLAERENLQAKIETLLRRELEWLKRGPKARTGKDRRRKMRIQDLMDGRVQAELGMAEFSSSHRRLGKKVLELHGVRKAYDGLEVIKPFSYGFRQGERIGVVGPNGSGKTTFLDLLTGQLEPDDGLVDRGVNTVFGYYDQLSRPLNLEQGVLDYIRETGERIRLGDGAEMSAAKLLETFGFPAACHRMGLGRLSGGERRRLYLIKVLMGSPNFLVMDEPTNDLDIDVMRRLEEYILAFSGCVVLVSHDRAFLDRTTDYLFLFDGSGGIRGYAGSYSDYRLDAAEAPAEKSEAPRQAAAPAREKKKMSFKERREYEAVFAEIEALEKEKAGLEADFTGKEADPAAMREKSRRYALLGELLEAKTARWEQLAALAE